MIAYARVKIIEKCSKTVVYIVAGAVRVYRHSIDTGWVPRASVWFEFATIRNDC
jgi:hypothetical protein